MSRKILILIVAIVFTLNSNAQYYYKDIVSIKQSTDELLKLKENKFRSVTINSYESNGDMSEGFVCQKKINKDYTKTEIITAANVTPDSYFISWFDKEGVLQATSDSSEAIVVNTSYTYNEKKELILVQSSSRTQNDDYGDDVEEKHVYTYASNGLPKEMLLIKNSRDTSIIDFMEDETNQNHVGIEKNTKTGDKYYYYYNSKGWISDIVHSYSNKSNLIPDFVFEYNRYGQVIQMIASEDEGRNAITWKYSYENGLRIGERCYSKYNRQLGTIEYIYK